MKSKEAAWRLAAIATAIWLAVAGYGIFFVAPREATMGQIQRIFYFHAGTGMVGYLGFFVSFLACIGFLASREPQWDWMAVATAEAGLVFNAVVLVTGPIWGKPVWGIWWTWDARLTLDFVLELLYIAYLLLRAMVNEPERRAMVSSIFGIFAFLDVPLSYFSIRWWRTEHPQPVIAGGPGTGMAPGMWDVFIFTGIGLLALLVILCRERYRLEALRHEMAELAASIDDEPDAVELKGTSL